MAKFIANFPAGNRMLPSKKQITNMKISFVGLGIMGSRMAINLLNAGIELTVYNRSTDPRKKLIEKGAKEAETLDQALRDADIVFTMLSRPEVVSKVMFNDGVSTMKQDSLWVDCSTVNPSFTKEAEQKAKEAGINYLEAPVAGSLPQAEAAELVFFVGGNKMDLEKVSHLIEIMGKKTLHLGDIGKGASFKLVVNMMLGTSMMAFAEALRLGESMGLEKEFLLNTLPGLPVAAPFTQLKAGLIKEEKYDPQFPLELLHKDLHLASVSANENGYTLSFADAAKELYQEAINKGMGREDMAAIYKSLGK
ncbi:NAD(P)-dependent oxidoreductase [Ekhidna sp.]